MLERKGQTQMCTIPFDKIEKDLQSHVHDYYKYQLLYLRTSLKENKLFNEKQLNQFNKTRTLLENKGCTFIKLSPPQKTNDRMKDEINHFLYQQKIQEIVIFNSKGLLPPDNLEWEIRTICDNVR